VQNEPPPKRVKKHEKRYSLDQCVLYKVGSRARLSQIVGVSIKALQSLCDDEGNYKVYTRPEEICPYTKKLTKSRTVQEPAEVLKAVHARINSLLVRIKAPDYCHGAMPGRSYRSNAKAHLSSSKVATFDLKSFFPSTSASRVYDFFRDDLKCAPDVAELLSQLCTYKGVLPTGSPVSPLMSFHANRRLFEELHGVATECGLIFSVYIDDITYSGNLIPIGLRARVKAIVEKYGHRLSVNKTRVFGPDDVKHITGVVVSAGKIGVPHVRFQKARGIQDAIDVASSEEERLRLTRKLAGLLGEAAFLDPAFKSAADHAYKKLAALNAAFPARTVKAPVRRSRKRVVLRPAKLTSSSAV
jgi:RNA-directed DNA polymerase